MAFGHAEGEDEQELKDMSKLGHNVLINAVKQTTGANLWPYARSLQQVTMQIIRVQAEIIFRKCQKYKNH